MAENDSLNKLIQRVDFLENELKSIKSELNQLSPTKDAFKKSKTESNNSPIVKPVVAEHKSPKKTNSSIDWEILLGGNILGKLGLSAILLASIWFIKFAFDNQWINESGRIFIGLCIGFFTIATGLVLAKRKIKIVPESIIGTGVSVIYISIYGAYYYYDLISTNEAFVGFTILTIGISLLAGQSRLQILYIFSLFGSILAPILLSSGENSYRFLFIYLTIINSVFFYISQKNAWRLSPFILLLSNCIIFSVWLDSKLHVSSPLPPLFYLSGLFLLFGMREVYTMPRLRKSIDGSSILLIPLLVISVSGFGYSVTHHFYPQLSSHILLLQAFMVIGLLKVYEKYAKPILKNLDNQQKSLSGILFLSWLTLLFSSISDFSTARWITVSWILFAGGLSIFGSYLKNKMYLIISTIPWFLALLRLYFVESLNDKSNYFIVNTRFGLFVLATAILLYTYQIQKKNSIHKYLVGFVFTALFTLILGTLIEIHYYISNPYYRNLGYSYVIAFYMIAILIPGFKFSYRSFRQTGIFLGIALVSKFYLYDIWTMSIVVRIIAGFSLGVGLVVLSIIYQKYKDKINVNTILKLTVFPFLLISFLASPSIYADEFKNNGYKYVSEVKGLTKELLENENLVYGKIRLNEEISRYHVNSDLRLVYRNELIPFFHRRVTNSMGMTGKTKPIIEYTNVTTNGRIYVLKFEEPPAKTEYTQLEISGTERYETGVYISLGDEPNNWQEYRNASIYNYYDEELGKINRINFRSGKYKYARIEFDSKYEFEFAAAIYAPTNEKAEFNLNIKMEDLSITNDSDKRATLYHFENPNRKPISRIVLNFEDPKYHRNIEFYQKETSTKEFISMMESSISKKPDTIGEHSFDLPHYKGNELKFYLINNEDKPLKLKSIEAYSEIEELVFELPKSYNIEENSTIMLYYGNEYVRFPKFDIQNTYDEKLKHVTFKIGDHTINPEFSYSYMEPPVSSWIIRLLFLSGLLLMAYPSYSILKKYGTELDIDSIEKSNSVSEENKT